MRELMELRQSWNKLAYSPSDLEAERHSARQILELQRRFFAVVEARRREPKDDVLSVMCAACLDGERPISTAQLVAELLGLLEAGQETVSALIANTIYHVLHSTSLWPKLATDDEVLAASINETLRYCSGIRGVYRRATDDVELDQVTIREGSKVLVMLAALGKDPEQLEDPNSYNPTRGSCPHMAFGRGIHFCIGGPIAKAQAKVALRTLSRRIPDLTLGSDFVYDTYGHPAFQIPRALHVVWQPRLNATG
jgi:cytochrome P450